MLHPLKLTVLFACLLPATTADAAGKEEGEWRQLFDGKSLEGWTPKIRGYEAGVNHADTFRVEDRLLKIRYDGYDDFSEQFGHLFFDEQFSNYRLRVEYRFVDGQAPGGPGWAIRNSGVMVHGEFPETMSVDQDFPVSIEVQLLGGVDEKPRPTANLCTPGTNVVMDGDLITRHCTSSKSETYRGDQWVTVEIEVRGGEVIRHLIDGEVVLEYEQPQLDPHDTVLSVGSGHVKKLIEKQGGEKLLTGGSISLQSESHPLDFRKVEILVLD